MSVSQITAAIDPSRAAAQRKQSHRHSHSQSISNTSSQHTLTHVQSHLPQQRHHDPSISQTAAQAYKDGVFRQGERRALDREALEQSGGRGREESDNEEVHYPYKRVTEPLRVNHRSRRVTMPPTYSEPAFVYHRSQAPVSHPREELYYPSSQSQSSSAHGTDGSHRKRRAVLDPAPTPMYSDGGLVYHRSVSGGSEEGGQGQERRASGVIAPRPMRAYGSAEMEEYSG
ncbi:hypothetical protein IAR50_001428 [Cryptococcus sp. DSM 104548]